MAQTASKADLELLDQLNQELTDTATHLGKLPKPDFVYAATIHHGKGAFAGTGAGGGKPRPIHLLNRGDVKKPGVEMGPGTLAVFSELPSRFELPENHTEGDRRVALADWLASRDNHLTWRSIVNRVWQYHFGRGLVETPNDFGRMGAVPSHPELLDWLAVEFRDGRQSLKQLHRLIVTSHTYRQESRIDRSDSPTVARALQIDADNSLLWRMNRRKLDAEAIRDAVLAVSGKLNPQMGGPAFQDFVIQHPEHSPHYQYHLHDPDDTATHRRSVYRFIVRSQLQPFMTTLDCADPSQQVGRRNESLTPLQALALLNDGFMVTMSRHFAEDLQKDGKSLREMVQQGSYRALGRELSPAELDQVVEYAEKFGLANACRVLFNLNEFSFVD